MNFSIRSLALITLGFAIFFSVCSLWQVSIDHGFFPIILITPCLYTLGFQLKFEWSLWKASVMNVLISAVFGCLVFFMMSTIDWIQMPPYEEMVKQGTEPLITNPFVIAFIGFIYFAALGIPISIGYFLAGLVVLYFKPQPRECDDTLE